MYNKLFYDAIYYTIYTISILYILNIYLIYTPTISTLIFKP